MAKTSIIRCDRFPPRIALPLVAMLSIALWVQVIGVYWGGRTITSAIWAWVKLALPIAVEIAQLR